MGNTSKKALLLFWHGIGDAITLTPALRYLMKRGYESHILCRPALAESQLLLHCPYAKTIPVPVETTPSSSTASSARARQLFRNTFEDRRKDYELSFSFSGAPPKIRGGKILRNMRVCGAPEGEDRKLEVFISEEAEKTALSHIEANYPNGYIFQHTRPSSTTHEWRGASRWMAERLPELPVFDTGRKGKDARSWEDINVSFVMAKEASHRVLSSSVFVHACDAMNVPIDVVFYGKPAPHAWPLKAETVMEVKHAHQE